MTTNTREPKGVCREQALVQGTFSDTFKTLSELDTYLWTKPLHEREKFYRAFILKMQSDGHVDPKYLLNFGNNWTHGTP